jgi:hypothetical protein
MSESQSSSWAPCPLRMRPDVYRRPRALLLADLILLGLFLVLVRWLVGGLLSAGFLSDPGNVPPFVAEASLDSLQTLLVFGLPLVLVVITAFRLRFAARATWPWSPLTVAWVALAFAETAVATPDFTAAVLGGGLIPAALIGTHQSYLRRAAGQSPKDRPWTRLRRTLTVSASFVVAIWVLVYVVSGAASIADYFRELGPEFFP